MADRIVAADDVQVQIKSLLDFVREGNEVLICEDDKVIARIAPASGSGRVAGLHRGAIHASADFDEPLPDSYW